MSNHIIGTAGHVDHGKTALIKALTGVDTSHLEEEKRRGITIDLGFAWLDLPEGGRAGIVDVPGHERFVKNMLAGAGGMDLVLLVVAADEGFMPQTREHLDILSLLNIRSGMIVLTKTDLVEPDWLELVQEEVRQEVAGSFLAEAPLICVSSVTGQGIDDLRSQIIETLARQRDSREALPARLPVDRVFSVDGFGTVVTGTLTEGVLEEGQEIALYPGEQTAKIRSIQVHGERTERAESGQRVAVNLAGLKREQVCRGYDLAAPDSMNQSLMLDVSLRVLPECGRQLKNGSRLHFHHGAAVELCKLVLLDREVLNPGEEGPAQLRFTQPVSVKNGDRFVVRFYSPVVTVGGGEILNSRPMKHKRLRQEVLNGLERLKQGDPKETLLQCFYEDFPQPSDPERVWRSQNLSRSDFDAMTEQLVREGALIPLTNRAVLHRAHLDELSGRMTELLARFHQQEPMQPGMKREELRSRLLPRWESVPANRVLDLLTVRGTALEQDQRFRLPEFRVQYTPAQEKLIRAIGEEFLEGGFEPRSLDEVKEKYAGKKEWKGAVDALFQSGELVALSAQGAMHRSYFQKAWNSLEQFCREHGEITLGQFRDLLGVSRKYALLLLESFDRRGWTQKTGEGRRLTGECGRIE